MKPVGVDRAQVAGGNPCGGIGGLRADIARKRAAANLELAIGSHSNAHARQAAAPPFPADRRRARSRSQPTRIRVSP